MSDDSTPKLEEELEMRRWAEERLVKLGSLLEIAESRDIDVTDARTNYYAARDELYTKKEPLKSMEDTDKGMEQLTKELNRHKFKLFGLPRWTYLSFVIAKYGLFSMFYGMATAILFGYILYSQNTNKIILNVPLWAALIAGLGASTQIMVGTVEDIKAYGIVREYKRLWYTSLPFLAVIFGFVAYLLTDLGMMTTTGGAAVGSLNATDLVNLNLTGLKDAQLTANNSILNASSAERLVAQEVTSFEASIGDNMRVVFCFLVGFATNAFIEKLGKLSEKL
ncbi:MAG: hypothetical protein WCY97_04910 [Methanothrix sp.]|jgi:hypothetical protein|nr:hypothetical protein [Methanothrix harundinacea]MDD3710038.1 hypothetical protein [Methanothrix sp.]MDD5767209.1 hypothetical protein [Methanothrix sp.]MDI9398450.1 hypothetical protein [Euryarchaeota archaeon]